MTQNTLNAALYARVSSEQQAEAGTIASQVEALLHRIHADGVTVDDAMRFIDEGYSGATLVRPALERLRDLAFSGAVDRLYVHNPDRLARKYAYQVLLVEELQRCGVELVFLNHELGRTPEQDLLLQVQGMVAEYERAKILERSRRGKRHAARRGSVNVLGGAPYGYRYITKHEGGGEAHYDVIFVEAQAVRQVFQWVGRDGLSINEVCRRLKKQGILTRTGKTRWDRTTVWAMLKNPAYKGRAAFGKTCAGPFVPPLRPYRGHDAKPRRGCTTRPAPADEWISIPVPAIVDDALFEAVQEQLAHNRKRGRQRQRGARHLLQGLVVCAQCGYACYAKQISAKAAKGRPRHYAYYRCLGTDAYRFGGHRVCDNKQVRTDTLEDAVWEDVRDLMADPQRVEQEYERRLSSLPNETSTTIDQLNTQLRKLKRASARLLDAYEDGWIDKAEFEQRMCRVQSRQEQFQTQADALADDQSQRHELRLVIGELRDFAGRVAGGMQEADWTARRDIIRSLVKEIQVGAESIQIVYRVNPPPFADGPERGVLQDCGRGVHPCVEADPSGK
jgi:site-specific DNA recombinase